MHTKGLLRGDKFNGRHSTVIPEARDVIKALKKCDLVSKISIGLIKPARGGQVSVKYTSSDTALRVQVRGTDAVQLLWVFSNNHNGVVDFMRANLDF